MPTLKHEQCEKQSLLCHNQGDIEFESKSSEANSRRFMAPVKKMLNGHSVERTVTPKMKEDLEPLLIRNDRSKDKRSAIEGVFLQIKAFAAYFVW